jgi:hypothetical protein
MIIVLTSTSDRAMWLVGSHVALYECMRSDAEGRMPFSFHTRHDSAQRHWLEDATSLARLKCPLQKGETGFLAVRPDPADLH